MGVYLNIIKYPNTFSENKRDYETTKFYLHTDLQLICIFAEFKINKVSVEFGHWCLRGSNSGRWTTYNSSLIGLFTEYL